MGRSLPAIASELFGRQVQGDRSQRVGQGLQLPVPDGRAEAGVHRTLNGLCPQGVPGALQEGRVYLYRGFHVVLSPSGYRIVVRLLSIQ